MVAKLVPVKGLHRIWGQSNLYILFCGYYFRYSSISANTASLRAVILFSKRIQMTKLSVVCSVRMAEFLLELRSRCTRMENTARTTRRCDLYLTLTDTTEREREGDSWPPTRAVICSLVILM